MKGEDGFFTFYIFTEFVEHCEHCENSIWTLLNLVEDYWTLLNILTTWVEFEKMKEGCGILTFYIFKEFVEHCWTLLNILTSWVEFEEMKGVEAFTFPQILPPDISDALPTQIERTIVFALLNPIPNSSFHELYKQTMTFFLAAESLSRPQPLLWVPHSWAKRADHVQWGPGEPFRATVNNLNLDLSSNMQWIIQSKPRTHMERDRIHFETFAWWLDVNLSAKWFPRHRTCGGSYPCGSQPWYTYNDTFRSHHHHTSSPKNDDTKTSIRINPNQEVTQSRLKTTPAEASLITSGIVLRWSFFWVGRWWYFGVLGDLFAIFCENWGFLILVQYDIWDIFG